MDQYKRRITDAFRKSTKKIKEGSPLGTRLRKKMAEIAKNPHHYKSLRNILKNCRRAHIGSFVLVFEVNEAEKTVIFHKFQHHDEVYENL